MALADDAKEFGLGTGDVGKGLPGHGLREEDHAVDRMARLERYPDLGILLEPADAGPMAGPRVDDDEGAAVRVDLDAVRRGDAHQGVIRRLLERAGIRDHLPFEIQQRRFAGLFMFEPVVAALAQGVPEQDGALRDIEPICTGILPPSTVLEVPSAGESPRARGRSRLSPHRHSVGPHSRTAPDRLRRTLPAHG